MLLSHYVWYHIHCCLFSAPDSLCHALLLYACLAYLPGFPCHESFHPAKTRQPNPALNVLPPPDVSLGTVSLIRILTDLCGNPVKTPPGGAFPAGVVQLTYCMFICPNYHACLYSLVYSIFTRIRAAI
jgi:hypothetical protein